MTMHKTTRDRSGMTTQKSGTEHDNDPRLPHERDESSDSQHDKGQPLIKQAYEDIERGLENTDLRGSRGEREQLVPRGQRKPEQTSQKTDLPDNNSAQHKQDNPRK